MTVDLAGQLGLGQLGPRLIKGSLPRGGGALPRRLVGDGLFQLPA